MEELLKNKYYNKKTEQKNRDEPYINHSNPNILSKPSNSFETSPPKSEIIYQSTINQNNPLSIALPKATFDKYKNQQLLNEIQSNITPCTCGCISGSLYLCKNYHHCHNPHILSPHNHFIKTITPIQNNNNKINLKKENKKNINTDLLTDVTELRNECKKIKEELTRTLNVNYDGSEFVKKLENEINMKKIEMEKLQENEKKLRYHEMLGKSFEVLNSVSNKTNDEKAKTKGGMDYYINNDQDYNELIKAQKKWVDEIPDKYLNSERKLINNNNNNNLNNILSKNQNIIDESLNDLCKRNLQNNNIPNSNRIPKKKFDPNRNNNKGYIISKNNKNDLDADTTSTTNNIKNNLNDISSKLNILNHNNSLSDNSNINFNNNIFSQNTNSEDDSGINSIITKNPNENAIDIPSISEINNQIKENKSPVQIFNERFLIIDEQGNPIKVNGEKLLGMELIPLLNENGEEILDDNGNIVFIGPDGEPKTQDELEPVLLDNDIPLVNEKNKPILGINGIPIINGDGSTILGPGELYDKNNKVVNGIIGIIPKDNFGNPIKINFDEENNENPINNNNEKINFIGNNDEDNLKNNDGGHDENINKNNFDKYKPLIGKDGKPIFDHDNNPIILDENNMPIIDSGIDILLDKNGKPVLNAKGKPILIDSEGRQIDGNYNINQNQNNNIIPENIPPKKVKKLNNKSKKKHKKKNSNNVNSKKRLSSKKNNIIINNPRSNRIKGNIIYFDDIGSNSKKIKYGPGDNSFYTNNGNCFACDLGCSISSTGYSPMTYSPYDNRIKRRNVTPMGNRNKHSSSRHNKVALGGDKDNNYYVVEAEN